MSYFDLIINITEAFICTLFVYKLFNRKFSTYLIASLFYSGVITACNFTSSPEIIMIVLSILILFSYSHFLNKANYLQNIFIALFINTLVNVATTLSICFSTLLAKFPIDSVDGYHLMAMISKQSYLFSYLQQPVILKSIIF